MKITWLGQAGLLWEVRQKTILIDPYLSDNVRHFEPLNFRRQPIDERFLHISPDVILITHNHLDHLDKETLKYYLHPEASPLVLSPNGCYQELRKTFPCKANYVLFNPGTRWRMPECSFYAVTAEHSDPFAIGVILSAEGKNYYVTGDTLYSERVFRSLPDLPLEAVFLPINGVGNNMNACDACDFASRVRAKYAVPIHFGMFDNLSPETFGAPNRVIPEIYREIPLP